MQIGDAKWGLGDRQSIYEDCSFDRTTMHMYAPGNALFMGCSFRGVKITGFFSHGLEFVDCVFTGAINTGVVLGTPPPQTGRSSNRFTGNDLSGVKLRSVDFRQGVDLALNKMPTGPDDLVVLDAARKLASARNRLLAMSASGVRDRALVSLGTWQKFVDAGQEQLYLRRGKDGSHRALLFDVLREAG
jgi:hypothetical protein